MGRTKDPDVEGLGSRRDHLHHPQGPFNFLLHPFQSGISFPFSSVDGVRRRISGRTLQFDVVRCAIPSVDGTQYPCLPVSVSLCLNRLYPLYLPFSLSLSIFSLGRCRTPYSCLRVSCLVVTASSVAPSGTSPHETLATGSSELLLPEPFLTLWFWERLCVGVPVWVCERGRNRPSPLLTPSLLGFLERLGLRSERGGLYPGSGQG